MYLLYLWFSIVWFKKFIFKIKKPLKGFFFNETFLVHDRFPDGSMIRDPQNLKPGEVYETSLFFRPETCWGNLAEVGVTLGFCTACLSVLTVAAVFPLFYPQILTAASAVPSATKAAWAVFLACSAKNIEKSNLLKDLPLHYKIYLFQDNTGLDGKFFNRSKIYVLELEQKLAEGYLKRHGVSSSVEDAAWLFREEISLASKDLTSMTDRSLWPKPVYGEGFVRLDNRCLFLDYNSLSGHTALVKVANILPDTPWYLFLEEYSFLLF